MINLSTNKQLDIFLPNTNKALAVVLEQATTKELASVSKDKDLKSIINSLLKESSQSSQSDKTLLNLVKNNPTLKELGNVSATIKDLLSSLKADKNPLPITDTLKNFLVDIKELSEPLLKQKLENSGIFLESKLKNAQNPQIQLKELLTSLEKSLAKSDIFTLKIISKSVQEVLSNTLLKEASNAALLQRAKDESSSLKELSKTLQTVLSKVQEAHSPLPKEIASLTSKLEVFVNPKNLEAGQNVKEILSQDLKAVLLKTSEEVAKSSLPNQTELLKNIDKLSLQIDYYQLVSHLSNSSCIYLPFSWEQLEEGNISLKKDKEDKFYCDIDLKLKEYGELKLRLVLYEKNQLNIQIHSDNNDFKEIIKENIGVLRSALIESHITPREIRIFNVTQKNTPSPYGDNSETINVGFEVKA